MASLESPTTDDRHIWDTWLSQYRTPALVVADDLGVFQELSKSPATAEQIVAQLGLDRRAVVTLLRFLCSLGFLVASDGQFRLADLSRQYMLPSSPFYWGPALKMGLSSFHYDKLRAAAEGKSSAGQPGPDGIPGQANAGTAIDSWTTGSIEMEKARAVAAKMHSHSVSAAIGAARNAGLDGSHRVLDVGGGSGCFSIAFARAIPSLRCTVLDLPMMCEVARSYIAGGSVADRVDTNAVDIFQQPWPRGYEVHFFSNIFHDWSVDTGRFLAKRSFEALEPGGRILLHEMLVDDDGGGPVTTLAFSMKMVMLTQGQQFTFQELRAILEAGGFVDIAATHSCGYYSIVSGMKPR
jgi:hypothetical protein